jgi:hypothetical protein
MQDDAFDAPHSFFFRNTRVSDAVHVPLQQRLFVFRPQITPIGDALVEVMRDQVENVFFQIRAGTTNGMHFALPDHFRQ